MLNKYTPSHHNNSRFNSFPELPEKYHPDAGIGKDACPWLDDYVSFSQLWSPRAYSLYHIACGLWVLSTIAARRVTVSFGKNRYTNMTLLLVARTGLWTKSTTAQIAKDLIIKGGFGNLLLPDSITPEKMVSMMALRLPEKYEEFSVFQKDKIKESLVFCGQRGWYNDEIGMLFHAMSRNGSSMASFHGLLRKLDDTEETYQAATIIRNLDIIQKPYLALIGCITPADLNNIASPGSPFWNDGFFARYLFAVPPDIDPPDGRFPKGDRVIPTSLITPLQEWNNRLGIPQVNINQGLVNVEHIPISMSIDQEVFNRFYLYQDGLREMIIQRKTPDDLAGNYMRLPEFALRFAMLFGSLSGSSSITNKHWDKAVGIAEDFRYSLHALYQQMSDLSQNHQKLSPETKILMSLRMKGSLTIREIQQQTRLLSDDIKTVVDNLLLAEIIEEFPEGKTVKYRLID